MCFELDVYWVLLAYQRLVVEVHYGLIAVLVHTEVSRFMIKIGHR